MADSLSLIICVVLPGFEPGQAEPKTAVLPLHHKTILIVSAKTSMAQLETVANL